MEQRRTDSEIMLPNILLRAANIPPDGDIDVTILEQGILITASEPETLQIPKELLALFDELGISRATVNAVLQEVNSHA